MLTYPAAWGARRREVLADARVARAGWPPVGRDGGHPQLRARAGGARPATSPTCCAARSRSGASLAVFDFGGGTLDIAVVRNEGGPAAARFAVLGSGGVAELGGLDLDAALVEHLGPAARAGRPGRSWQQLAQPATPAQWRDRRQFWDDVRGAKEMLSRTAVAPGAGARASSRPST